MRYGSVSTPFVELLYIQLNFFRKQIWGGFCLEAKNIEKSSAFGFRNREKKNPILGTEPNKLLVSGNRDLQKMVNFFIKVKGSHTLYSSSTEYIVHLSL